MWNKVCFVYGKDVQYLHAKRWFENFWSGILGVEDSSRPVRLNEIDTDKIKLLLDENLYLTARDIAGDLQILYKSVCNSLNYMLYCYSVR